MAHTFEAAASERQTFYEKLAATTWGRYLTQVEDEMLAHALGMVGAPGQALEIGCEAGRRSVQLARKGWQMSCVDINADALKICQQRIPGATCVLAKPEDRKIPAADHTLKLLLCIEVEVVLVSDWFLAEAHRVLADGGCLVSTMTNRMSYRALPHRALEMIKPRTDRDAHGSPNYRLSYGEWKRNLANAGFTIREAAGCCWFPFHRNSDSAIVPAATTIERLVGLRNATWFSPWVVSIAQIHL